MKTIIRFALLSTLSLAVFSCASRKKAATVSQSTATSEAPAAINPAPNSSTPVGTQGTSRFIVSFYSAGEGIDMGTHAEFLNLLNTYDPKIAYTPSRWGREGEKDYCLGLSELSAAQQAEFIKQANSILGKSKLVNTTENAKCEHPGPSVIPVPPPPDVVYRLVVSFYSEGEGIDLVKKQEFETFLNTYPKKIAYEPTRWGREGETDYCLKLNELSESEQVEFVRKAKESLSKSPQVHVDENAKCVHKH